METPTSKTKTRFRWMAILGFALVAGACVNIDTGKDDGETGQADAAENGAGGDDRASEGLPNGGARDGADAGVDNGGGDGADTGTDSSPVVCDQMDAVVPEASCDTCLKAGCCAELSDCLANPDCLSFADCYTEGIDSGTCADWYPMGEADFNWVMSCAMDQCPSQCLVQ